MTDVHWGPLVHVVHVGVYGHRNKLTSLLSRTCAHTNTHTHPESVDVPSSGDAPSPGHHSSHYKGPTREAREAKGEIAEVKWARSLHWGSEGGWDESHSDETRPLQQRITVLEGRVRVAERAFNMPLLENFLKWYLYMWSVSLLW